VELYLPYTISLHEQGKKNLHFEWSYHFKSNLYKCCYFVSSGATIPPLKEHTHAHTPPDTRKVKVKVKHSRYRPGVAQRVLRKLRFPDFVTTPQDGGKVVSLTHRPPLPPGNTPGTHFC